MQIVVKVGSEMVLISKTSVWAQANSSRRLGNTSPQSRNLQPRLAGRFTKPLRAYMGKVASWINEVGLKGFAGELQIESSPQE
jgi:hypothetical protein